MLFKKVTIVIVAIIILLGVLFVLESYQAERVEGVDSFEDCMDAGYPIMESFPRQCRTPDGRFFVEDIDQVPSVGENGTTTVPGDSPGDMERVPEELFPSDPTAPERETSRTPGAYDGCVITGCSGHVCFEEHIGTTCEFHPSYACYRQVGVCEKGNDNVCGWRQTEALNSCVSNAS